MGIMRDIQEVTNAPPHGSQSEVVRKAEQMRQLAAQQGRLPSTFTCSEPTELTVKKPGQPSIAFREW